MFYKACYCNFLENRCLKKNSTLSWLLLVYNSVRVCVYIYSYNGSIIVHKCVLVLDGRLERRTLIMRSESLEVPIVTLSMLHYIKKCSKR